MVLDCLLSGDLSELGFSSDTALGSCMRGECACQPPPAQTFPCQHLLRAEHALFDLYTSLRFVDCSRCCRRMRKPLWARKHRYLLGASPTGVLSLTQRDLDLH